MGFILKNITNIISLEDYSSIQEDIKFMESINNEYKSILLEDLSKELNTYISRISDDIFKLYLYYQKNMVLIEKYYWKKIINENKENLSGPKGKKVLTVNNTEYNIPNMEKNTPNISLMEDLYFLSKLDIQYIQDHIKSIKYLGKDVSDVVSFQERMKQMYQYKDTVRSMDLSEFIEEYYIVSKDKEYKFSGEDIIQIPERINYINGVMKRSVFKSLKEINRVVKNLYTEIDSTKFDDYPNIKEFFILNTDFLYREFKSAITLKMVYMRNCVSFLDRVASTYISNMDK